MGRNFASGSTTGTKTSPALRLTPGEPPLGALLFDLGGVLIDVDFDRAFRNWADAAGVSAVALRDRFSVDVHYERHERGEIDASGYFASLRKSLDIELSDIQFEEGWNAILGDEIAATTALLSRLRQSFPMYAFSNSNLSHQRRWERTFAPMLAQFERVFVSSELGVRKPDPEAYALVAREIGLPPQRILFFDDSLLNVEGARNVGMHAIHVTGPDSVRAAIASCIA